MDKHRRQTVHVPSAMGSRGLFSNKNRHHNTTKEDIDTDDDDEVIEEVLVDDPSSAYISGVGDLSCSVRRVEYRQHTFDKMKQEEAIEYVIHEQDKGHPRHGDPDEEVLVLVDEVCEEYEENTEVEYYEDSEIEEIELDDEGYEEIIMAEDALAAFNISSTSLLAPPPPRKGSTGTSTSTTSSATATTTGVAVTATTAATSDVPVAKTTTEHEHEDPPCREDVIEAITYIVRQEKVIEYGLMSKNQVDEMNALPLEELCEIMKHFEICDNNNATIQWELVLAMINPDYANLEEEVDNDNEEAHTEQGGEGDGAGGGKGCSHKHQQGGAKQKTGAAKNTNTATNDKNKYDDSEVDEGDEEADVFSVQSDVNNNPFAIASSSVHSSFSLEVDQSEGQLSTLSQVDADNSDDEIVVADEEAGTGTDGVAKTPMDPRIRAQYTKSMVELQRTHSFESK